MTQAYFIRGTRGTCPDLQYNSTRTGTREGLKGQGFHEARLRTRLRRHVSRWRYDRPRFHPPRGGARMESGSTLFAASHPLLQPKASLSFDWHPLHSNLFDPHSFQPLYQSDADEERRTAAGRTPEVAPSQLS